MKPVTLAVLLLMASVVVRAEDAPVPAEAPAAGAFRALCAAKAAEADQASRIAVAGKDNWLFLAADLRHLSLGQFWGEPAAKVSLASKPEWADPVPAILDFKAQMDKLHIELIVVPVPPKPVIYADQLTDSVKFDAAAARPLPGMDSIHQEFYKMLREQGVNVLDLSDALIQARKDANASPLYCKTDTHWSPAACELAARMIQEQLKGRDWLKPGASFTARTSDMTFLGDLAKSLRGEGGEKESLPARVIAGSAGQETVDANSPVLLLGDSHCLVFHSGDDMLGVGAGFVDQLAYELAMPVDLLGTKGSGATPTRINLLQRARGDEKYLPAKKVVIWCFATREFSQSPGWRKVPVVK